MYAAFALEESRQKRAETGQQEIIGEIKSDILRYNGNKEPSAFWLKVKVNVKAIIVKQ